MPLEHAQEPIRSSRCTSLHAGDSGNAEIAQGARHHFHMFGDTDLNIGVKLGAYEHTGPWTNRLILGDSLQV
jgi:hypothetical protein